MIMVAAAITGASSFVYEIGWVRMLNQSLGTTVHSFELMLAAFIFGLAFGGLWIRRRSKHVGDPIAYAGHAQVWMGIAALASIPVFSQSFRWVGAMVGALPKTELGYVLFSLGSGAIALLVMFPAAFFAGMTLPLFTMALLRRGAGEASIGRVYAANTLGAIVGVLLAVHVLIPLLGLRLAVVLAAIADIVLGVLLLWRFTDRPMVRRSGVLAAVGLVVVALSLSFGKLDPRELASGVFRHGNATLGENTDVPYFRDGKTASVSFMTRGTIGIIATNGKPDASIQLLNGGMPTDDEITMVMMATLPLAMHPSPKEIAVIGWGSGLSTHTLLGSGLPERVDTIEIEQAMYIGASNFGSRVQRAYQDPRSKLHIDDARTYFSTGQRKYDVILSEPSNPWVSGVASLFTKEFYAFLRSHLRDGGIGVQWIQSYELSDELLATMVAALVAEFPYVDAYTTNGADLLFVVSAEPLPPMDFSRLLDAPLTPELQRVGLSGIADVNVRKVGSRATLETFVALYGAQPHSDFYPVVSLRAPRSRYLGDGVTYFQNLMRAGLPVLDITAGREMPGLADAVDRAAEGVGTMDYWRARFIRDALMEGRTEELAASEAELVKHADLLKRLSSSTVEPGAMDDWMVSAAVVADYSIAYLAADAHEGVWTEPVWIDLANQPAEVTAVMAAYAAAAMRDGPAMREAGLRALAQLDPGRPTGVREQMLVVAILGAIAEGDLEGAMAIERDYGRQTPPAAYGFIRSYLLAWSDTQRSD
ncbi:spermidine synthase [Arenimonas daejeonensis]|uniref:spermidine synthase n=1 Tax=Arenimonas daejeonensis TaxID=370777 RepID=UPI001315780B|nr:fused MFS/spermidine synthase [Arenimonas daejeonensis]